MYEYYRGTRSGLSVRDVSIVQGLYGARTPDKYEGAGGNDTTGRATPLFGGAADRRLDHDRGRRRVQVHGRLPVPVGDGRSPGVRTEPSDGPGGVARLPRQRGGEGVDARPAPQRRPRGARLTGCGPGATYFVRVSAARQDVFGVGSYELDVRQHSVVSDLVGLLGTILDQNGAERHPVHGDRLAHPDVIRRPADGVPHRRVVRLRQGRGLLPDHRTAGGWRQAGEPGGDGLGPGRLALPRGSNSPTRPGGRWPARFS